MPAPSRIEIAKALASLEDSRLPSIQIARWEHQADSVLRQWRKKACDAVDDSRGSYLGPITPEQFAELTTIVATTMFGISSSQYARHLGPLRMSMAHFSGRRWANIESMKIDLFRIVSSRRAISMGYTLPPPGTFTGVQFTPVEITDARIVPGRKRDNIRFEFHVLGGTFYGNRLYKEVRNDERVLSAIAWRLGIASVFGESFRELVRLRVWVIPYYISADLCGCVLWYCNSAFKSHNRKRANDRREPCPRTYTQACSACHIGYSECPNGTHPTTYILATCSVCSRGWFGSTEEVKDGVCMTCILQQKKAALRSRVG